MDQPLGDWLAGLKPSTSSARICSRADLVALHDDLQQRLASAVKRNELGSDDEPLSVGSEVMQLADQIAACEAEMDEHMRGFEFTAIGGEQWDELQVEHPPTDKQKDAGWLFNPATFKPAAIAASCTSDELTEDQARAMAKMLSAGQWGVLWAACHRANHGGAAVPKSVLASGVRRAIGGSSTGPSSMESPLSGS